MKACKNCNSELPDGWPVCTKCNTTNFESPAPDERQSKAIRVVNSEKHGTPRVLDLQALEKLIHDKMIESSMDAQILIGPLGFAQYYGSDQLKSNLRVMLATEMGKLDVLNTLHQHVCNTVLTEDELEEEDDDTSDTGDPGETSAGSE